MPNKIYLIEKDNGMSYEDYRTEITEAFTSYRKASQSLLDEGFVPYPHKSMATGNWGLVFVLDAIEGQLTDEQIGELIQEDKENGIDSDADDYDFGYEISYDASIIEMELKE